jgi:hypothetical protein
MYVSSLVLVSGARTQGDWMWLENTGHNLVQLFVSSSSAVFTILGTENLEYMLYGTGTVYNNRLGNGPSLICSMNTMLASAAIKEIENLHYGGKN